MASSPVSAAPMQAQIEPISSSIWTKTPPSWGSSSAMASMISELGRDGIAGEEADSGVERTQSAGAVALDQQAGARIDPLP